MQRRFPGRVGRVALPVGALLHRFGFLVMLGLAATMMVVAKVRPDALGGFRTVVVDASAPVLDALSRPVESVNDGVEEVQSWAALREDNRRLTEAVDRLKRWEMVSRALEQQNAQLRALLNLQPDRRPALISARVIGDSGSAYVRTVLVNAGARDGVRTGLAAVTGDGLAGRVVEVGKRAARVLLLTDLNSRIPVVIEDSRERAVLAGDNSATGTLQYLSLDAEVAVGARIVTSGHGGVLPPGLPVGVVSSVANDLVRVRPLVDLGRIEYVRLLDWQAPVFEPVPKAVPEPAPQSAPAPVADAAPQSSPQTAPDTDAAAAMAEAPAAAGEGGE